MWHKSSLLPVVELQRRLIFGIVILPYLDAFPFFPEMAKGPISNVYITGGSSANGARYPAR